MLFSQEFTIELHIFAPHFVHQTVCQLQKSASELLLCHAEEGSISRSFRSGCSLPIDNPAMIVAMAAQFHPDTIREWST